MGATRWNQIAFLIGRVMVGGMYLGAGITNLIELEGKAGYTASKGIPDPKTWVILASVLLVVACFSFITGLRPRLGIGALVLFLIPVTLIMHNFWVFDGMQRVNEMRS
ncbi:MAG: DoxX family protein, partial [Roseiflexaceae bacterium]